MFVLDTDSITHDQNAHPILSEKVSNTPREDLFTTSVSVEEQLKGRLILEGGKLIVLIGSGQTGDHRLKRRRLHGPIRLVAELRLKSGLGTGCSQRADPCDSFVQGQTAVGVNEPPAAIYFCRVKKSRGFAFDRELAAIRSQS